MALLAAILSLASGCAFNLADVRYTAATPLAASGAAETFTLTADVRIDRAPCNYDRVLKAGTLWESVGSLPQGRVFRSKDQSLTLECSNVFEAYPVVEQSRIVAFYLPVEKGLVALPEPVEISVKPETGESL
jgi:hypothetical protein